MNLHLGSGGIRHEGWINVDIESKDADIVMDLRERLPFEDGECDYIFHEHFLEHLTRDEGQAFLKECCRVLKNDGLMRISTPSLRKLASAYLAGNIAEWGELWQPSNPCHFLNEGMRSWGHQFLYDEEELVQSLLEAGFLDIKFVNWRHSDEKHLCNLESRPYHQDLIVEVSKKELSNVFVKLDLIKESDPASFDKGDACFRDFATRMATEYRRALNLNARISSESLLRAERIQLLENKHALFLKDLQDALAEIDHLRHVELSKLEEIKYLSLRLEELKSSFPRQLINRFFRVIGLRK